MKLKKVIKWTAIAVGSIVVLGAIIVTFSPKPISLFVRSSFEGGNEVAAKDFNEVTKNVKVERNIDYGSSKPDDTLDIIWAKEKAPTIFWTHGGAFVGGDKQDVEKYASYLAAQGYNVVNLNYARPPEEKYPTPLKQMEEAYTFIQKNKEKYRLNLDRVYFAGDSAGAQLASQFVAIQMNEDFSPSANVDRVVPEETIKGAILLCGPYDLKEVAEKSPSALNRFLFERVGWAYMGDRDWKELKQIQEASLLTNPPAKFVPSFITDGNTASFESQGKRLAEQLKNNNDVTEVFYPLEDGELGHEYQFEMNKEASKNTFDKLIDFLKKTQ